MAAQPICNWQVGGFESPLGLQNSKCHFDSKSAVRDVTKLVTRLNRNVHCVKMKGRAGIGERSNPADCKSAALCFVGSNPTPCTRQERGQDSCRKAPSPHSSVVEHILGKNEVPSSSLGVGSRIAGTMIETILQRRHTVKKLQNRTL